MNAIVSIRQRDFTPAQVALIKKTVARDTNGDEFDHFMAVARNLGLDPLRRQICAMVFSKDDEARRNMAIIVQIDGMRAIANRCGDYRPMETAPLIERDDALKSPANPLGIVRAEVKLWKKFDDGWHPVAGEAYWDEFAPVKEVAEGYDWVETGQVWPDSNKPKMKKVPRGEVIRRLDANSNWARMPTVMISKCAESQALRRGWPEQLSGAYSDDEMERAIRVDVLASELVAEHEEQRREQRIGHGQGLMFQTADGAPLVHVARGKLADFIYAFYKTATSPEQIIRFRDINAESLKTFWAWEPGDAHECKQWAEQRIAVLTEEAANG